METRSHLSRMLDSIAGAMTPEVAGKILSIRADAQTESRVNQLRQKAHDGVLTADEADEYQQFIDALDVISIIQSKARKRFAMLGKI